MSTLFLKYKVDGPDSKWIEVDFPVDAIRIQRDDTTVFEITPTQGPLGAFTIKSIGSVNFIAKSEDVEVMFRNPDGVEVF